MAAEDHFRAIRSASARRSQLRFPEKERARQRLRYAVSVGKIAKPDTCARCGWVGRIHGHHHDYSKPLEVEWLCPACHGIAHTAPKPAAVRPAKMGKAPRARYYFHIRARVRWWRVRASSHAYVVAGRLCTHAVVGRETACRMNVSAPWRDDMPRVDGARPVDATCRSCRRMMGLA